MSNNNPLSNYFRQTKTYISIPSSKSDFMTDKIVEFSNDRKELGILPMTGLDEMTIRNPDALLNGEATIKIIQSCVPSVKDPKKLFINDVNALMVAIKLASTGPNHPITTGCPSCSHENSFNLNLESLIHDIQMLDSEYIVKVKDLTVYVRPYTYEDQLKALSLGFEENKTFKLMTNATIEDIDRIKAVSSAIEKISKLNFQLLTASVYKIGLSDGTVVDNPEHIKEFIQNVDLEYAKEIDKKVSEINVIGVPDSLHAECSECKHTWKVPISFNPTDFFINI